MKGISYYRQLFNFNLAGHNAHKTPTTLTVLFWYFYALCSLKVALLILVSLKSSLRSIHSLIQTAANKHTRQGEMRCWWWHVSKKLQKCFHCAAREFCVSDEHCRSQMQSLSTDWLEMGYRWKGCFFLHASFEPLFLLQLELPRIVFERRWNFCLIVIKIWSTLLCSLARRSVCVCAGVCVGSLSDLWWIYATLPMGFSYSWWFIHFIL